MRSNSEGGAWVPQHTPQEAAEARHRQEYVVFVLDGTTGGAAPTPGDWAIESMTGEDGYVHGAEDFDHVRIVAHDTHGRVLREIAVVSTDNANGFADAALMVGAGNLARAAERLIEEIERNGTAGGVFQRVAAVRRALDVCRGRVRA